MSTDSSLRRQTLALAALMQAVWLADRIARTGSVDVRYFEASINSLFAFAESDPEAVVGGLGELELGLRALRDALGGGNVANRQVLVRYAMGLMYLQKQLSRNPDTAAIVRNRLQHAEKNKEFEHFDINQLASSVAAIYKDTISNFRYRIQIGGSMQHLQNPSNANRIRALLLAGIRAVYLWRQAGGSRWRLLFERRRILAETDRLLEVVGGRKTDAGR